MEANTNLVIEEREIVAAADVDAVLLDTSGVAKLTSLSKKWFENARWKQSGPPFIKMGRVILYDREATLAWFRRHQKKTIN